MPTNYYHILSFIPGLEREEMTRGHEKLAQQLVASGKLRIDAYDKINFARLLVPEFNISMMFSEREIFDQNLLPQTKKIIARAFGKQVSGASLEVKINHHIKLMRDELAKYGKIAYEEEMRLARLLVQSTHPVVMMLILLEGNEVYVSYSHNIGDVLDIATWVTSGTNSGMQSTDGKDAAIFISCGGNPLGESREEKSIYGDGWPAIARLIVIGAQEFAHYSDIMRDKYGRQISRYSANFSATKANKDVAIARLNDIKNVYTLKKIFSEKGFIKFLDSDRFVKVFSDNKINGFSLFWQKFKRFIFGKIFLLRVASFKLEFLSLFFQEKHPAIMLNAMFEDMLFNLAPKADVYRNENKEIEEAIACVEALARVPQQVCKWGRSTTKILMSELYKIYYNRVIPGCIDAYENISGNKYDFDKRLESSSLLYKIKKLFKKTRKIYREIDE